MSTNEGVVVEVTLTWGGGGGACVMATKYLHDGERFAIGEGEGCDAVVPHEVLRAARVDVVTNDPGGALVIPPHGAHVWVDGFPAPAEPFPLGATQVADVALGAFTLRARLVEAEHYAVPFAAQIEAANLGGFALSAMAHVAVLAALALFLPSLGATDDDEITRDQLLTMQHLLNASAEHEQEAEEALNQGPTDTAEDHGPSGGGRAVGKEGAMGKETAPKNAGHWSLAGDSPRELQNLTHEEKVTLVKDFGAIGLLAQLAGDPNAPTVPWTDILRGADSASHQGGIFGPQAADSWGINGLGFSGLEEGGGGNNLGIGVNDIGGLSASLDRRLGSGDPGGWGHGCGGKPCLVGGTHKPGAGFRMPREILTNGRLPADVIQRIVRQNAGRYRACYEGALRTNPALEGRVEVRFVIDRQGAVSMAQDGESDLPSDEVRKCIVRSFYALSFPPPQNGTVTVTYPMALTPAQ
jgi:hypothetical protein